MKYTIKELIKDLELFDDDAEVVVSTPQGDFEIESARRSDDDIRNDINVVYIVI